MPDPGEGAPPAWRLEASERRAALGAGAALVVAALASLVATWDPWGQAVVTLASVVLLVAVARTAWRLHSLGGGLARAWGVGALVAGAVALVRAYEVGARLVGDAWPAVPNAAAFGAKLGAFVVVLLLVPPTLPRRTLVRFVLDALVAAGSLLSLMWVSFELTRPGRASSLGQWSAEVLDPVVGLALASLVLLVAASYGRRTPAWYQAVVAAAVILFVSGLAATAGAAAPAGGQVGAPLAAAGLLLSVLFLFIAVRRYAPWPALKPQDAAFETQWAALVPFGMALLGYAYDYWENDGLDVPLFYLAWAVTLLTLVRTVLLLMDNRRLARQLAGEAAYKTQLLRFISHEMANPLFPLAIQLRLLRAGQPADPQRAWAIVDRSIARLDDMSHQVRLLALAETGHLVGTLHPGDVGAAARAAAQAAVAQAEQKGLRLVVDLVEPLPARLDEQRFGQVLDNLLANALKFTPEGGRILVRGRRTDAWIALDVTDTGVGLTLDQRGRLFQAFGRVHDGRTAGLGLGLYLCKLIVEAHGGAITADSPGPGQGSTFRVRLPVFEGEDGIDVQVAPRGPRA